MAAMGASQQKLAVLDTNVLLHLAEQHAPSHNVVLRLVRMGLTPVVVQTVVQELGDAAMNGSTAAKRTAATTALKNMLRWGIQPVALKPVGNGICDVVADAIASRRILPEEERNDAYILIEASFWNAYMLVTWDGHFLKADQTAVDTLLTDFDLKPVKITPPSTILGY